MKFEKRLLRLSAIVFGLLIISWLWIFVTAEVIGAPSTLTVVTSHDMQPFAAVPEDEVSPSAALENTGYYNPQTTLVDFFIQGSK